jgi:serine/threonine protein kinase
MSSVDQVRKALVESRLMSAQEADKHLASWQGSADRSQPAKSSGDPIDWLVANKLLTEFQGEALKAGHTGPFTLGPYEVRELIAPGILGNLYRARHVQLEQAVSLKVFPRALKDDVEKLARVEREVRVSVELDHPNVLRTFHMGRVGDVYYIAFENLQGETLASRLQQGGRIPVGPACKLIRDAALGLKHLHEHGVIHRDVRPAHMWITESGLLKIMELGAARDAFGWLATSAFDSDAPHGESLVGTCDYMAPEQAREADEADHRSDIYSLGCTLYHCLAGQPPFIEANPVKLAMKHATERHAPIRSIVPDAPQALDEVLDSMLAKNVEHRFQYMEDVVWALERFVPAQSAAAGTGDEVRDEFLSWLTNTEKVAHEEHEAAPTPELADFLSWMADKEAKEAKKAKRK